MLLLESKWKHVAPLNSSQGDHVAIAKQGWLMEICSLSDDAVAYPNVTLVILKINPQT